MFLSVVFFGNHSAVDIDVQTCTHPMLGSHIWGSCCQLSFSKLKTFFVHRLDLKNTKFKDANSNGNFEQSTPRFTLIILYLAREDGGLSVESRQMEDPQASPAQDSVHSSQDSVSRSPLI